MAEHKITVEFDEELEVDAGPHGKTTVPADAEATTDDASEAAWIAERAAIKVGNDKVKVESDYGDGEQHDIAMAVVKQVPAGDGATDAVPMSRDEQVKASLKSSQEAEKTQKAASKKASAES